MRIPVWDNRRRVKLSGRDAPTEAELTGFLDANPHCELYCGQIAPTPSPRPADVDDPPLKRAKAEAECSDEWLIKRAKSAAACEAVTAPAVAPGPAVAPALAPAPAAAAAPAEWEALVSGGGGLLFVPCAVASLGDAQDLIAQCLGKGKADAQPRLPAANRVAEAMRCLQTASERGGPAIAPLPFLPFSELVPPPAPPAHGDGASRAEAALSKGDAASEAAELQGEIADLGGDLGDLVDGLGTEEMNAALGGAMAASRLELGSALGAEAADGAEPADCLGATPPKPHTPGAEREQPSATTPTTPALPEDVAAAALSGGALCIPPSAYVRNHQGLVYPCSESKGWFAFNAAGKAASMVERLFMMLALPSQQLRLHAGRTVGDAIRWLAPAAAAELGVPPSACAFELRDAALFGDELYPQCRSGSFRKTAKHWGFVSPRVGATRKLTPRAIYLPVLPEADVDAADAAASFRPLPPGTALAELMRYVDAHIKPLEDRIRLRAASAAAPSQAAPPAQPGVGRAVPPAAQPRKRGAAGAGGLKWLHSSVIQ